MALDLSYLNKHPQKEVDKPRTAYGVKEWTQKELERTFQPICSNANDDHICVTKCTASKKQRSCETLYGRYLLKRIPCLDNNGKLAKSKSFGHPAFYLNVCDMAWNGIQNLGDKIASGAEYTVCMYYVN